MIEVVLLDAILSVVNRSSYSVAVFSRTGADVPKF